MPKFLVGLISSLFTWLGTTPVRISLSRACLSQECPGGLNQSHQCGLRIAAQGAKERGAWPSEVQWGFSVVLSCYLFSAQGLGSSAIVKVSRYSSHVGFLTGFPTVFRTGFAKCMFQF